jgi:acyl carrier protein
MTDAVLDREVRAVLAAHFSVDVQTLHGGTLLVDDLYADSMELIDLVMTLNRRFKIEIEADELLMMKTLEDVMKVVRTLTDSASPTCKLSESADI